MEQREGVRRSIPASFDALSAESNCIAAGATSAVARVSGDWYRVAFDGSAKVPVSATWEINGEDVEMGWINYVNFPNGFVIDGIVTSVILESGTVVAYKD